MVVYAEKDKLINKKYANKFLSYIENNPRQKPWTIVNNITIDDLNNREIRANILKPLLLNKILIILANGNIKINDKSRLEQIT